MPYKICPKCNTPCGVRSYLCKCGHQFIVNSKAKKRKPRKRILVRTKISEIEVGDVIKCLKGPYYKTSENNYYNMGESGKFKITKITKEYLYGRRVKGDGRVESEMSLIYIGPKKRGFTRGFVFRPHKIKKLIQRRTA